MPETNDIVVDEFSLVNRSRIRRPSVFSRISNREIARDTARHFEFQGIVDSPTRQKLPKESHLKSKSKGLTIDCSARRFPDPSFIESGLTAGLLTPSEQKHCDEFQFCPHLNVLPEARDRTGHIHSRVRQLRRETCSKDVSVLSLPNSPIYSKFNNSGKQMDMFKNQSILSEGPICRICHEDDADEKLVSPCYCAGSLGMLHLSCLERWLDTSNTTKCEICLFQFIVERKPHPMKWYLKSSLLETERKNLYCDVICLSLFAPITIICTALCLVGAHYFGSIGKTEIETCLIIVCVLNLTMFCVWCLFAFRKNCERCRYWRSHYQVVRIKHCEFDEKPKYQPKSKKMLSFKANRRPSKSSVCSSMGSLSRISECRTLPLSESEGELNRIGEKPHGSYLANRSICAGACSTPLTVAVNTVVVSDPINSINPRVLVLNYSTSTPKVNAIFNFHSKAGSKCSFRGMETNV